jgi:2-keto-4-pentenoate hydratase/2-oxohepta-3-ene-1,7-dioic acid hydratase in catechol pathway
MIAPYVPHVQVIGVNRRPLPYLVRNIYCIGRNYAEHARELGNAIPEEEPVIFLKSSSSLRALQPSSPLAFADETFHFECELVLLVGSHVPLGKLEAGSERQCLEAIGLGLDLTRRSKQSELKKAGLPWTVSKSFSGSAVVSPMKKLDSTFDLDDIEFDLRVNGELRQHGHTDMMLFNVSHQLRHINSMAPLLPGDLLFTGTPAGVGEMRQGDHFRMSYVAGRRRFDAMFHNMGDDAAHLEEKPPRPAVFKGVL